MAPSMIPSLLDSVQLLLMLALSSSLNHGKRPGMQRVGNWIQNLPVTDASNIQPGYTETLVAEPVEEEMDGADEEMVDEGVN